MTGQTCGLVPSMLVFPLDLDPAMKYLLLAALMTMPLPGLAAETDQSGTLREAIDNPQRPAPDRERDTHRKPAAVLEFFAIKPGMTVLDLFSGGGYYTEILSRLVGPEGKVIAHNNAAYLVYARDQIEPRYADNRLGNVELLQREANALRLQEESLDAALLILSYHDFYYQPGDGSWPAIDATRLLREIFGALKPGAVLGIVDHSANRGAPETTGNSLHRIDPTIVRENVEAIGFVFDGESKALTNPEDDRNRPMYAEDIRGRTDRFVHRYRKPLPD